MLLSLLAATVLLAEPSAPPLVPLTPQAEAPPMVQAQPLRTAAEKEREARDRRRLVLLGAGAALFALSYGVSVVIAATSVPSSAFPTRVTNLWPLYIPLGGPVGAIFTATNRDNLVTTALVFDAFTQLGAVALLVTGAALTESKPPKPTAWLIPSLAPGFAGASFGLQF